MSSLHFQKEAGLKAKIRKLKSKAKLYRTLAVVSLVAFLVPNPILTVASFAPFFNFFNWLSFLLIICIIAFVIMAAVNGGKLKALLCYIVYWSVLERKFELSLYEPKQHISEHLIRHTELISHWDKIRGSDLIEGEYKGVPFSFSDISLLKSGTGDDSDTTRFKGQWIILELAKEIPCYLRLREREKEIFGKKSKSSDMETANTEFNERFQIQTNDPQHAAFYILTPRFMECILRVGGRADCRTFISIEGKLIYIALYNNRDLFEPGRKDYGDNDTAYRARAQSDVNYITGIIDKLLANEWLFGANASTASVK